MNEPTGTKIASTGLYFKIEQQTPFPPARTRRSSSIERLMGPTVGGPISERRFQVMLYILVDTCVWLDLAKDHKQIGNLQILEELVKKNLITLIVPQTILDEFARNKSRVIEENSKSISSTLRRAKDIVVERGDRRRVRSAMRLLNEIDYQIPKPKDLATSAVSRIEKLLMAGLIIEISKEVKLRAAERAVAGKAPFHRGKNSINDAILIEVYGEFLRTHGRPGARCAFVTHNYKDFSGQNGSHKLPHPDIVSCFSKIKSRYFITLGDALKILKSKVRADWLFEEYEPQPVRGLDEISSAIDELITKIWYDRHQVSLEKIASGKEKIVEKLPDVPWPQRKTLIQKDIWEGARKSAEKVEKRFGKENLGPWSKFEWGMMNGKVSALRWVLGEDWDELYT